MSFLRINSFKRENLMLKNDKILKTTFAMLLGALCFGVSSNAYAQVNATTAPPTEKKDLVIDINEGFKQPKPIAITNFSGPMGENIARVVREDLDRSGLFTVQDPATFIAKNNDVNLTPKFSDWRYISSQGLVVGKSQAIGNKIRVEFRLWDIYGESQVLGLEFSSAQENWRRIAHKISDAIYNRLTGTGGMFDSRVIFVAESGPKTKRIKRLALMDQDGANPSYLTDGSEQILNPRFSRDGKQVVYTALSDRGLRIWVLDIETGRKEMVSGVSNLVFAPRFSPDGKSVIYSIDKGGNTDIYVKNLRTGSLRQLTQNPSIDTSPSFSEGMDKVVFTSDRSGSPQIYIMNADGSNEKRLSFGRGQYSTPVFSPSGSLIAFTKYVDGRFYIGIMDANGGNEHLLTSAYLVEGPSFSPNGRAIVFQREEGPGQNPSLWTIDISGANLRKLSFSASGSDPAWSPLN